MRWEFVHRFWRRLAGAQKKKPAHAGFFLSDGNKVWKTQLLAHTNRLESLVSQGFPGIRPVHQNARCSGQTAESSCMLATQPEREQSLENWQAPGRMGISDQRVKTRLSPNRGGLHSHLASRRCHCVAERLTKNNEWRLHRSSCPPGSTGDSGHPVPDPLPKHAAHSSRVMRF